MRRRKGWKRTQGHQHQTTMLKIDKIEFDLRREDLERAVSLVE